MKRPEEGEQQIPGGEYVTTAQPESFTARDEEELLTSLVAHGVLSLKEADIAYAARPNKLGSISERSA